MGKYWEGHCGGGGESVHPPPQTTRELQAIPNLKRGLGQSPGRKRALVHSELELTHTVTTNFILDTFVTHKNCRNLKRRHSHA